jgi:DNA modification methylase
VECLGMTFENEKKRRVYFLEKLSEKLKDPEFRKIEGFPIGEDEDILALSDPPYYTACPNPFIEDFIKQYGKPYDPATDDYRREPFAADVSEGKNDPIYNAHSYHTKVPHKAIMRYILHYTEPGDVVFDGFCGTGMTGVAAQLCGDKTTVESLGYRVNKDGIISQQETEENGKKVLKPFSKLGSRRTVLNDLSPAAMFIAYNYNTPVDVREFEREAKRILKEVENECGWMYETLHADRKTKCRINYTVWSDVFVCPECTCEVVFWEAAVDKDAGKVNKEFPCPNCHVSLTKRHMQRAWVTKFDKFINHTIRQAKQVPVLINYSIGKKRHEKRLDKHDLNLIEKIERIDIPYWFPTERMPEGEESRRNDDIGITHVHHFYGKRTLWVLASLLAKSETSHSKAFLRFLFEQWVIGFSRLNRYSPHHYSQNNRNLSGTLYVGSQISEVSLRYALSQKIKRLVKAFSNHISEYSGIMTTQDTATLSDDLTEVDYIFTDPPFGGNLMYSELNFLWEAWLRVLTSNKPEAIKNSVQGKRLVDYQHLMTECFKQYYRVLKPGRWMTVEFHNSKNSVWNAIQEALQHAGFVIADVRTLDKQQGTFKQVTSGGAVKQDLIISAYKPNGGLEERFKIEAGAEDGVWDFVRSHLKQLPVFVSKDGHAEAIAERQNFLLFDRMVAFHVQRGVTIPLSAAEFYAGLEQRFPPREGMYFLTDQAAEYDKKRMTVKEILQLQLFVSDEASAIQWLKQQLTKKPQTAGDLKPQFMIEIGGWQKNEKMLELDELLEQNFLRYDGKGEVPSQIHTYLSSNFKELRNLAKDDPALRAKGKDRCYVPDPNKAGDLEKLRERALMREFEEYRESKQKRLKVFRLEAVRAGFKKAWQERDYATIIAVARKIPEKILQEDPKLLMWYDQAVTRTKQETH